MSQEYNDLAADLPTTKIGGRKEIDWEAMRDDWRAGIMPVLQLSKKYGVSRAAILKHWEKEGVERDLAAKIEARAASLVTQAAVTPEVTVEQRVTERAIVEANAQMQANIMLAHRRDVPIARDLVMALLAECKATTDSRELFEQLGELMRSPDEKGIDKLNDLYQKVVSLPGRVDSAKKLAEAIKTLVELERKVFKIEDAGQFDQDDQVVVIRREIVIN